MLLRVDSNFVLRLNHFIYIEFGTRNMSLVGWFGRRIQ